MQHNFRSWCLKTVLCLFCNLNKTFLKLVTKRLRFFSRPKQLLRIDEKSSSASVLQHHCAHFFLLEAQQKRIAWEQNQGCCLQLSHEQCEHTAHCPFQRHLLLCVTASQTPSVLHYQGLSVLQEFCSLWDITVNKKSRTTDF